MIGRKHHQYASDAGLPFGGTQQLIGFGRDARGCDATDVAWVQRSLDELLPGYEVIEVPPEEWMAANVLLVNGTVCMHEGFHQTLALLRERKIQVRTVDISEFLRAEAGLTCLSIIFNSQSPQT